MTCAAAVREAVAALRSNHEHWGELLLVVEQRAPFGEPNAH
ncbi:hypothetical protein [Streptomyces noursei]